VPKVKVLYHAQCFDGFSSAAMFTRFYREQIDSAASFVYQGVRHGAGGGMDEKDFDADVHCVVDFRYDRHERLDWWFDHHRSAFVTPEERAHFEDAKNPQHFWNPDAPSCAGYIARTTGKLFGFDTAPMKDLIDWADHIDAAQYPDPQTAVELNEPVLQLMSVMEHLTERELARETIEGLTTGHVKDVAMRRDIQERFGPIKAHQQKNIGLIRESAVLDQDVVFVDMTGSSAVVFNKWVPYYLFPDATYVVTVSETNERTKISVGSNPWRANQRRHDLAQICERYGGGGHAVVGGVTLPAGHSDDGRAIAREIVQTLQG
jgi:hypothetical protein